MRGKEEIGSGEKLLSNVTRFKAAVPKCACLGPDFLSGHSWWSATRLAHSILEAAITCELCGGLLREGEAALKVDCCFDA